jgi:hypothetical protein
MLDGGSSISSVAEDFLVTLLNGLKKQGIRMGTDQHPVRKLEK